MSVSIDVLESHLNSVKEAIEAQRATHTSLKDAQKSYDQAQNVTQEEVARLKAVLNDVD